MKKRDIALRLTGYVAAKTAGACLDAARLDTPIAQTAHNWLLKRGIDALHISNMCLTANACSIPDNKKEQIREKTKNCINRTRMEFTVN